MVHNSVLTTSRESAALARLQVMLFLFSSFKVKYMKSVNGADMLGVAERGALCEAAASMQQRGGRGRL